MKRFFYFLLRPKKKNSVYQIFERFLIKYILFSICFYQVNFFKQYVYLLKIFFDKKALQTRYKAHKRSLTFMKRLLKFMKRSCNGTVNGKERLGTLEPKHSNAYEPIVENVHDTFRKRSCSRKKTNFICDIPSKYFTLLEKAFIFINMTCFENWRP